MTAPFPAWYNSEGKCEFHEGAEGHTVDNCIAFKYKVQELINKKLLTFKEGEPIHEGKSFVRSYRPICGCLLKSSRIGSSYKNYFEDVFFYNFLVC
jgi:hypothetical protein